MKTYPIFSNSCSFFLGCLVVLFFVTRNLEFTPTYRAGFEAAQKEAFAEGLAVQEIVDDKIVYRWKELHKIGYE